MHCITFYLDFKTEKQNLKINTKKAFNNKAMT